MEKLPFEEQNLVGNQSIRIFDSTASADAFEWHRDREDRIVIPLNDNDWLIQMDNELPSRIDQELFIPKEVYHRVIPGTGLLKIKLIKLK